MKQQAKKTGDFGVGQMVHAVHVSDDVRSLNAFYEDVFGGLVYQWGDEPGYLPDQDRWASLIQVSDFGIEVMAPNKPVDPTKPIGKFFTKFGRHLHSVGYLVDDFAGYGDHLLAEGISIGGRADVRRMADLGDVPYLFPSPRDTAGLMIELCKTPMPGDPRVLDSWSSLRKIWEFGHPLTIRRLAYITLGVRDLSAATATYVKGLQAVAVHDGVDEAEGCRYQIVQLGDCLIRLAQPIDESGALGEHVAKWGNTIYSATLKVRDLDSVETWLTTKNIRHERLLPQRVAADPADCFGAPYFFTTEDIPEDPLDD